MVLDGVQLTALGARGGYSFSVYANLPTVRTPLTQERSFEIGEFGSFDLSMPRMNRMTMSPGGGRTLQLYRAGTRDVALPLVRCLWCSRRRDG